MTSDCQRNLPKWFFPAKKKIWNKHKESNWRTGTGDMLIWQLNSCDISASTMSVKVSSKQRDNNGPWNSLSILKSIRIGVCLYILGKIIPQSLRFCFYTSPTSADIVGQPHRYIIALYTTIVQHISLDRISDWYTFSIRPPQRSIKYVMSEPVR